MPRSEIGIHADRLFTGAGPLVADRVVTVVGDVVGSVEQGSAREADLSAALVSPGFVDLQINGGGGRMFNADPTVETLIAMRDTARKGGTTHILPAFITADGTAYLQAEAAVSEAIVNGIRGIPGLHLESPFLSPERPGIHLRDAIRRPTEQDLEFLCRTRPGSWMITVAPEEIGPGPVRRLSTAGWHVFAGHSAAAVDDVGPAIEAGLSGATHLFNAMSQFGTREPGLVGATLHHRLHPGIIADGHHVHPASIGMARTILGERLFLVSNAMATLSCDDGSFDLDGRRISLNGGRLTDDSGRLAGAHLAMDDAVRNVVRWGIAELAGALTMATSSPAAAIGRPDLGHAPWERAPTWSSWTTISEQPGRRRDSRSSIGGHRRRHLPHLRRVKQPIPVRRRRSSLCRDPRGSGTSSKAVRSGPSPTVEIFDPQTGGEAHDDHDELGRELQMAGFSVGSARRRGPATAAIWPSRTP